MTHYSERDECEKCVVIWYEFPTNHSSFVNGMVGDGMTSSLLIIATFLQHPDLHPHVVTHFVSINLAMIS